ncbi:hypothetical protein ACH6CV_09375 [Bacillota bacterium Meth-B3]|nr:hypothetical protein [Christensenellaceae bacterium]
MKITRKNIWGFRSGTPWKSGVALIYYLACAAFLVIAMTTPPLIPAGAWDAAVVKLSSFVLFVWMLSPAIFLSDTPMRGKLPFFKDRRAMRSLVGLMIVFVLFHYLFMAVEGLHTPEYKAAFTKYIGASFDRFIEAGLD